MNAEQTIKDLHPDELRELLAGFMEEEYLLIDVRQPEEYAMGHLPGALHIPLVELDTRIGEIGDVDNKIFYCLAGGRSLHASFMAARAHKMTGVYNLVGGIRAWDGHIVAALPRLKVFDRSGTLDESLKVGMNLEKGAEIFYQQLTEFFAGTPLADSLSRLADAEGVHANLLFEHLSEDALDEIEDFDSYFEGLSGELLENGESTEAMLRRAKELEEVGHVAVLELALAMELEAHDLYRNLATRTDDTTLRAAFLELATHENSHAQAVASLIGRLAESLPHS